MMAKAKKKVRVKKSKNSPELPDSKVLEARRERSKYGVYARMDKLQKELNKLNDYNRPLKQKEHEIHVKHARQKHYENFIENKKNPRNEKVSIYIALMFTAVMTVIALSVLFFMGPETTGQAVLDNIPKAGITNIFSFAIVILFIITLLIFIFEDRHVSHRTS